MIEAHEFVSAAREQLGIRHYSGVPCSFLTPFINHVINDRGLGWIASANEGDAVATAAGFALGGKPALAMMQNSGLGNAVNPLSSLSWTFRLPILLVVTQRGAPGVKDEPQHRLMGRITHEMLSLMEIPSAPFPTASEAIVPALEMAGEHLRTEQRPWALIMQKDTVKPSDPGHYPVPGHPQREMLRDVFLRGSGDGLHSRTEALERVVVNTDPTRSVLIATTGYTGRELCALADRPNHFYMVGSMGCASALGLGLALARPDLHVIVLDGDGAALMRMGNLATLGTYAGTNLTHLLLDNEVHDSTGGQATVSPNVCFAAIAAACRYRVCYSGNELSLIDAILTQPEGPRFAHLKLRPGASSGLPRPRLGPVEVKHRLMQHIGTVAPASVEGNVTITA